MIPLTTATTALHFLLGVVLMFGCGYGVVRFLLPDDYREYRYLIMPPVGYAVFCWLAFSLSGTFQLPLTLVCWVSLVALLAITLLAAWTYRGQDSRSDLVRNLRTILLLCAPVTVVVLWPLFYVGSDTYLGAVNPDYFATFKDNVYLLDHSIVDRSYTFDDSSPFFSEAGTLPPSARFSSGLFALLLQVVLSIPQRSALTLAIALFVLGLPLSVFFMARAAFGQPRPVAWLSAILIGISGPITLSYLYFYVGQNSGLSATPLLLTLLYLLLVNPSLRLTVLAALMLSSLFVMYFGMLPYAVAPPALVGLYLLVRRELPLRRAIAISLGLLSALVVVNLGMLSYLATSLRGWQALVGKNLQGQFFIDFLTEQFFPMFFGFASYPVGTSYPARWLGDILLPVLFGLSLLTIAALGVAAVHWARGSCDKRPVALAAATVAVYVGAWWYYTFRSPYGYAVFKMASWLQFALVPPLAYGLWQLWQRTARPGPAWRRAASGLGLAAATCVILGGNLVTSLAYGRTSLGRQVEGGYIVNAFGMSGNYDYLRLADIVERVVGDTDARIGLGLSDSIQNNWASYYLRNWKLSILTHYLFPEDDENLPDIQSRLTVDVYGNTSLDKNPFFHGISDDYYLLYSESQPNADVVQQDLPVPIWQDSTFRLLRASDVHDLVLTGRGFYRLEQQSPRVQVWWPARFRWSNTGGEFYLLRAAHPGQPYRLSFAAIVGHRSDSARRVVELFHNGTKFDEVVLDGSSRVYSAPFFPTGDVDRIVFRIQEDAQLIARPFSLWNKQIPADYRGLNLAVGEVRLFGPGGAPPGPLVDEPIEGVNILAGATAFNGLEPSGWVREAAELRFIRPANADHVDLGLQVPADAGLPFPFEVTFTSDGIKRTARVARPGPLTMSLPIGPGPETSISVLPQTAEYSPVHATDLHPIVRSVLLTSVIFRAGPPAAAVPLDQLAPTGVDPDGWMARQATLELGDQPALSAVDVDLELPTWAHLDGCDLTVAVDQQPVLSSRLPPGVHTIRIPLATAGPGPAHLEFSAESAFPLPAPDPRTRALRILSVRPVPRSAGS